MYDRDMESDLKALGLGEAQVAYVTSLARLFPEQGYWTEEAYLALPETNRIVELSDGSLVMSPAPTDAHAHAVGELYYRLRQFVDAGSLGQVRVAPSAVRIREGVIREPDVLFFHRDHLDRMTDRVHGPPDWVAEVISPGSRKTDLVTKLAQYAEAGIPEYWIVDPERREVRVMALDAGSAVYREAQRGEDGDALRSQLLEGFEIEVSSLMA